MHDVLPWAEARTRDRERPGKDEAARRAGIHALATSGPTTLQLEAVQPDGEPVRGTEVSAPSPFARASPAEANLMPLELVLTRGFCRTPAHRNVGLCRTGLASGHIAGMFGYWPARIPWIDRGESALAERLLGLVQVLPWLRWHVSMNAAARERALQATSHGIPTLAIQPPQNRRDRPPG